MTGRPLDPIVRDAKGRSLGRKGNRGVRYRPVLTIAHLRALGACERAQAQFIAAYPNGALATSDTARAAAAAGFDLCSLGMFLDYSRGQWATPCYCPHMLALRPHLYTDLAVRVRLWIARYNQGLV
jgi:hypothetical protein